MHKNVIVLNGTCTMHMTITKLLRPPFC